MADPLSGGYLLTDSKKSQGCQLCMMTCSLVHEGEVNLSLARIQVMQLEKLGLKHIAETLKSAGKLPSRK